MNTCGWFKFEHDPLTIRHTKTNQSITVRGEVALTRNRVWSCEYVSPNDGDSLLFDIQFDLTCSRNYETPEFRLNYKNIFTTPPDFSRWKFVDDFLTDALTCWPDLLPGRRSSPSLRVEGAWCNGEWTPSLTRLFSAWKSDEFFKRAQTYSSSEPAYTLRQADQRWEYIDCEFPQKQAALNYSCLAPEFVPYLGLDEPVTGFQGKVPYLITKDRRAYIAPISFRESMERDDCLHPRANYIYLNDNFFYQFELHDQSISMLHSIYYYGFRDRSVEKCYWPLALGSKALVPPTSPRKPNDIYTNHFLLPYRVWRESLDAITDAWSAWDRPARKVVGLSDSYVGGFGPKYGGLFSPVLYGGYSAGLSNENFRVSYKYAQPIIPLAATR